MSANRADTASLLDTAPGGSPRERLLRAALVSFHDDGALSATLEDIRRDAGVSVGTLYHYFPDKAGLAAELYVELLAQFQDGFMTELRAHARAEEGVKAGVRFYLRWVSANRAAAALLLGERPGAHARLRHHNQRFFAEAMAWWQTHVHYGTLRDLVRTDRRAVARSGTRVHPPLGGGPRAPRARRRRRRPRRRRVADP